MTSTNLDLARFNMVEQQVRTWDVLSPDVLDALANTPREHFAPETYRNLAYADIEIPLGHGQVMLKPIIAGRALQALNIQPNERVLEIGTGTGYCTALMAALALHVDSVETVHDLHMQARTNLTTQGIHNASLFEGDGANGFGSPGSYDAIFASASYPGDVSQALLNNLKIGGRLFAVIGESPIMQATLITRVSDSEWQREALFETDIQAMQGVEKPATFVL